MEEQSNKPGIRIPRWLKRMGWAGFIFFTVKGFVWLAIFYFGADALVGCLPN